MSKVASASSNEFSDFLKTDMRIRSATEAANVALWSYCPDTGENWASSTWFDILGYDHDVNALSLERWLDLIHEDDAQMAQRAFADLVDGKTDIYRADFRLRARDGSWRWIGASGTAVERADDRPAIVYGMAMDITERKKTEAKLAQTARTAERHRERLFRLAENSPAALFEFHMDREGTVSLPYMTTVAHALLGVAADDVAEDGLAVFKNIFEEDMAKMGPAIEESRAKLKPFKLRYRVHRADLESGYAWLQASSVPRREEDGGTLWFGSIYDVTTEVEREALLAHARDNMRHLALHDGLTGLPNRRRLDEHLKERSTQHSADRPPDVLMRIDLDRFKYVNDTLGHAAGDAVLCHVARVLSLSTGTDDLCSRVGGDEFCVLMGTGKSVEDARVTAAAIEERLGTPFFYEGKICRFGASFGIATSAQGSIVTGDLMSFADAALYEAKAAGRGRVEVFSRQLHDGILENRRLAAEIEGAIENRAFEPFFQPQVSAHSGDLVGAEVLARWRRADGSVVPPDKFMPVAEQIRAVPLIDRVVMERTVAIVDGWRSEGLMLPKLSFNVSAGRLHDKTLVAAVRDFLDWGVKVSFELLESILLEEEDGVARRTIELARDAGISIEIDDFGTGHASILGVLEVSPDVLKIDRRLTANVVETQQSRDLVASIFGIAKSLGIRTTAEGVETPMQADVLRQLGCDVFQGYLYAKPLAAADFFQWAGENGFSGAAPRNP
ncbi:MAG: EAL domain-containing protein [Pseudomonadota bacterium]